MDFGINTYTEEAALKTRSNTTGQPKLNQEDLPVPLQLLPMILNHMA